MTLAELRKNILAYADFKHRYDKNYSQCLKEATAFYLRISFNGKIKPSSIKFANFWH